MRFLKLFSIILAVVILFSVVLAPPACNALNLGDAFKVKDGSKNDTLDKAADVAGYNVGQTNVNPVISKVISVALSLLGVIFLVLMIYGGYIWMMARGNEQDIEKAKNILKTAITGVIIVAGAYAISYFVIEQLGTATFNVK